MLIHYAGIIEDDIVNSEHGVAVSVFTQGCPHRCPGCFNPETWDQNQGIQIKYIELRDKIFKAIQKNEIQRNLSILGGEPLTPYNKEWISKLILDTKKKFPTILIYLWTGYYLFELDKEDPDILSILNNIDVLIDGPFIETQKTYTHPLIGSLNQNIHRLNLHK